MFLRLPALLHCTGPHCTSVRNCCALQCQAAPDNCDGRHRITTLHCTDALDRNAPESLHCKSLTSQLRCVAQSGSVQGDTADGGKTRRDGAIDLSGPMRFHRHAQRAPIQVQVRQLAKLLHVAFDRVHRATAAAAARSGQDRAA